MRGGPSSTWERVVADASRPSRRTLALRGLAWSAAYQVFQAALSFGAMLFLVRVIPPAEYGRVGVMLGLLTVLSAGGCGMFLAHALQHGDGAEPDWSLHWSAAFYIQGGLSIACHAVAALCWMVGPYRPIAPLLHLAAIGVLLDWPNSVAATMLRRDLDLRRYQMVYGVGTLGSTAVTLAVAAAGGGAYAIVLGSNVVLGMPFAVDLLVVRRWRPNPGWWRWPDWGAYAPALRFGSQQVGSALLASVRGALQAAVLPGVVGYASIGYLSRAQVLFSSTVGRGATILQDTLYPFLPRYAGQPTAYAEKATLFARVVLLVGVPGALYIGLEGRALSRVLYGERWIGADPLIWPVALMSLGAMAFLVASAVLLAAGRLRSCLLLDLFGAVLAVPTLAVAWAGGSIVAYAWALAVGQGLAGVIALAAGSSLLAKGWIRAAVVPPAAGAGLAAAIVLVAAPALESLPLLARLVVNTLVFGLGLMLALRGLFPRPLAELLELVPGGTRVRAWLRLGGAAPVMVAR